MTARTFYIEAKKNNLLTTAKLIHMYAGLCCWIRKLVCPCERIGDV